MLNLTGAKVISLRLIYYKFILQFLIVCANVELWVYKYEPQQQQQHYTHQIMKLRYALY